jgi:CDP-glucose 4,6-dehydratase
MAIGQGPLEGLVMLEFYKNKTVFITGHTGFKGSWLSEILLEAGAKVVGYSLEPPTNPNLFSILGLEKRMTSVIGDIRDFPKLKETIQKTKPDVIIHLAAQPIVLVSYDIPRETYEINVMGTVNLLEAARECGTIRSFLNVTTDKVYDNPGLEFHRFKEDEKLDGYDPYSNSKSCSELVTHAYKRSFFESGKMAVSTARAGNVIGGGDFSADRIIPDCVRAVESGEPLRIRNHFSVRPYQFVLEPLFAYLLIAQEQYLDKEKSGYYNVGPDESDAITTGDLVALFAKKWGSGFSYFDQTAKEAPHEAGYLALDNSLLKKTFRWHPVYHVDSAVQKTVDWTKVFLAGGDVLAETEKEISDFAKGFVK